MLTRKGEGARCANTGTPSVVQAQTPSQGSQSRVYGNTNRHESSVPASRRGSHAFRHTLAAVVVLGIFIAAEMAAGYFAEHTPTLIVLAVCLVLICVVGWLLVAEDRL